MVTAPAMFTTKVTVAGATPPDGLQNHGVIGSAFATAVVARNRNIQLELEEITYNWGWV